MTASILVCVYTKHGMTCELGGDGTFDLVGLIVLISWCSIAVTLACSRR